MGSLIALGVGLLALVGIVTGGIWHYKGVGKDAGRAEVRAEYQPLIAQCGERKAKDCAAEWSKALGDVATLKDNEVKLKGELKTCSDATQKLEDKGKAAAAFKASEMARQRATLESLRADRDRAIAEAAQPSAGGTCEERMARIVGGLNAMAARELLFRPPAAAGAEGRDGDGKGASPGSLRIGK